MQAAASRHDVADSSQASARAAARCRPQGSAHLADPQTLLRREELEHQRAATSAINARYAQQIPLQAVGTSSSRCSAHEATPPNRAPGRSVLPQSRARRAARRQGRDQDRSGSLMISVARPAEISCCPRSPCRDRAPGRRRRAIANNRDVAPRLSVQRRVASTCECRASDARGEKRTASSSSGVQSTTRSRRPQKAALHSTHERHYHTGKRGPWSSEPDSPARGGGSSERMASSFRPREVRLRLLHWKLNGRIRISGFSEWLSHAGYRSPSQLRLCRPRRRLHPRRERSIAPSLPSASRSSGSRFSSAAPRCPRTASTARSTEEGERLLRYARRILALDAGARHVVARPVVHGVVRLGLPEHFAAYRLAELLSDYVRALPTLRLDVRCGTAASR